LPLRVLSAGPLTTIQDSGRSGYERFGVPQSGAMDWFALRAANALVGNPREGGGRPGAAALEFAFEGPVLQASDDCLVAVAGWGHALHVQGRPVGAWRAALVRRGEILHFDRNGTPGWGYLAVLGGIDVPPVMGSRSTYLRGGFGGLQGRALREGDALPLGNEQPPGWQERAGRWLPPNMRPIYSDEAAVPVIAGPQEQAFTVGAIDLFYHAAYTISATSDRMGYRLNGPHLAHRDSADLISEPLTWGAVQVPADGMPMVMMSDRPTTGGYPKIATVARAGLPLLAQAMPVTGQVRFQAISFTEAQRRYRQMAAWIETGIEGEEDAISG
jgi:antagonist of KipI